MNRYIYQGLMGNWYILDTEKNKVIAMCNQEENAALICEALNA